MKQSMFWTLYRCVGTESICSQHKSARAALRAAAQCEKAGGVDHRIVEVIEAIPYKPRRQGQTGGEKP